jgi:large subunit ribosomal protein L24
MIVFKKLKKNDIVKIIAGKDNNKSGKILDVNRKDGRVLIEGLNIVKKTMRKSKENQNGGIKDVEAFLDISNVILICPKCKKETRVGFKVTDNKKIRVCKKCNAEIDG